MLTGLCWRSYCENYVRGRCIFFLSFSVTFCATILGGSGLVGKFCGVKELFFEIAVPFPYSRSVLVGSAGGSSAWRDGARKADGKQRQVGACPPQAVTS